MVTCQVNGQLEVVRIAIDPRVLDPGDLDMLQDLIVAGINQALRQARELAQAEMQKATGLPLDSLLGKQGS